MQLSLLQGVVALVAATGVAAFKPACIAGTEKLAAEALAGIAELSKNNPGSSCTVETAAKRQEWSALSVSERIAYTDAVKCLMAKPSILDPVEVPGAKSRYDDFVAIHINQTFSIHATANFLSWHRYFTWVYEQALRNECGYEGYQPYWNWGKYALDPLGSPLFDGSAGSIGGNGVFAPHGCTDGLGNGINCIPAGEGGGCVETGPFAGMSVNLGPVFSAFDSPDIVLVDTLFKYNPRCLRRDINVWVSSNWTTDHDSKKLITQNADIVSFQNAMQGDFPNGVYGVHSGGHYTLGGDPGADFFSSTGDPAFFLHHAQVDRTWWIWQNYKSAEARLEAIGGTITISNQPPSRDGTLDDLIDMDILADSRPIREVMSTVGLKGGPLCYVYV
ncbi:hypothetical protein B0H67DRAFT_557408 [Lasiosphaeris hirsuta]|uniref:Tyrosinase copper-binding domain-containing protein n=1 Tax=Lasiosphaeris hirsuta TaxID=260670 RepID=A0AA40DKI7_9PEZI|nr:hypothetical protein B0H67DRAFT_557408 [Lasiosphaeris hirsuta]